MAWANPKGRANYEPNSWGGAEGGPRETPDAGFPSYADEEKGPKLRIRSETFADHYSQARQFYVSQTETERAHIVAAFTFELSKVETLAIRTRMVSHLLNVHENLGAKGAEGLRVKDVPRTAESARPAKKALKPSLALSIVRNGPESFQGRKLGVLVTDGVDANLLQSLTAAIEQEGAILKLIAPMVGGVVASDGRWIEVDKKIDRGPSVLFDAVALLPSREGAQMLAKLPAARDFVADAFAHCKFIGYTNVAIPLLDNAGIVRDAGVIDLEADNGAPDFLRACGALRFRQRETTLGLT